VVSHAGSDGSLGFGTLAKSAGALPMPGKIALKEPKKFTRIGEPMQRVDSLDKVKGATQFCIDVRLPGMKVATVKACPAFGGKWRRSTTKRPVPSRGWSTSSGSATRSLWEPPDAGRRCAQEGGGRSRYRYSSHRR
jgi:hypothetical protein